MKFILTLLLALSVTLVWAQKFSRQAINFTLHDKTGKQLTDAAIARGQVKVYSLRDPKTVTDPHLFYDRSTKVFNFSESTVSPGISLAFVSATDTMYISVYGRSGPNRVIEGVKVQRGSYVLTSNEFVGNKRLKVENWANYLEDEEPVEKQDLTALAQALRGKQPISLVNHTH